MKKIVSVILAVVAVCCSATAQPARAVLDKVSTVLGTPGGLSASYSLSSEQYGNTAGTIAIKGNKFRAMTSYATVWFDGTTQWTYVKDNNEVNINTPTEGELQAINPYSFINMYKSGFAFEMETVGTNYRIHLTATDKSHQIQEMFITVSKSDYVPSKIRMRQGAYWSDIDISDVKKANFSDATFKFNSNEYPGVEIIDLR